MPNIDITNNTDVLAAIPALLGFAPEASFVLILLARGNNETVVHCALRGDINITASSAATLPTTAASAFRDAHAAILVAICGDWLADHARTILDTLRDALHDAHIDIYARLTTHDVTQPGQWTDIDTGATGPVHPYTDSVFAAEKVFNGETIAADRDQIVREFTATTNPAPITRQEPSEFVIDTFEEVAAIITGTATPSPTLATRVGILITQSLDMRDTMLLLGADQPGPSARLWTSLANQLTGAPRVQALTVAATFHYINSDAVRAGIALDVADTDALAAGIEYPHLARLLLHALQAGLSPARLREALHSLLTDPGAH